MKYTEEIHLLTEGRGVLDPYASSTFQYYGLDSNEECDELMGSVGPEIYGGNVEMLGGETIYRSHRTDCGLHQVGARYDGNGYSLINRAINIDVAIVHAILADFPSLKHSISAGNARPLHICGMSRQGQLSTQALIDAGADLYALDIYNYNALHRMASNDLEIGGEALVKAGMDPNERPPESDSSPMEIAKLSQSNKFLMTMQRLGFYKYE